jgi:hypothetical protein
VINKSVKNTVATAAPPDDPLPDRKKSPKMAAILDRRPMKKAAMKYAVPEAVFNTFIRYCYGDHYGAIGRP